MKRIQQFPPCRRRLDIIHKANVALSSKIILIVSCQYSCLSTLPPSLGSFERRPQLCGEAASKLSISGGNEASLEGLATPPNGHGELVRRLRRETITFSALHVRLYRGFPIGFSGSGIREFPYLNLGIQDVLINFVAGIRNYGAEMCTGC